MEQASTISQQTEPQSAFPKTRALTVRIPADLYDKWEKEANEKYAGHMAKTLTAILKAYYNPKPQVEPHNSQAVPSATSNGHFLDSLKNAFPANIRSQLLFEDADSYIKVSIAGWMDTANFKTYRSIMENARGEFHQADPAKGITKGFYLVRKIEGAEP